MLARRVLNASSHLHWPAKNAPPLSHSLWWTCSLSHFVLIRHNGSRASSLPRFPPLPHPSLPLLFWLCSTSWQDDWLKLVNLMPFCSRHHWKDLARSAGSAEMFWLQTLAYSSVMKLKWRKAEAAVKRFSSPSINPTCCNLPPNIPAVPLRETLGYIYTSLHSQRLWSVFLCVFFLVSATTSFSVTWADLYRVSGDIWKKNKICLATR